MAMSLALLATAQDQGTDGVVFDENEDTTQITTIADIINVQEMVSLRNSDNAHINKVWSYSSYFDMAYNNPSTLTPTEPIELGYNFNGGLVPEFKSDWGASLVLGHNYGLHKPIAGCVKFNIDYTYIDLNVNHFKTEGDGSQKLYDSSNRHDNVGQNEGYMYIPWCMEKYEVNYGMSLGASITAAPFVFIHKPQLHFFKFNFFYHVGYHVSALMALYDEKYDANPPTNGKTMNANNLNFGHGMTTSFGFRISWKTIGFGYESRSGKLDYVNFQKPDFGGKHYKFDSHMNRIFLEIRY